MRRGSLSLVIVGAAAALMPTTAAHAGTAALIGGTLRYQAARGEANDVLVRPFRGALVVRDRIGVRPGKGCRRINAKNVLCAAPRRGAIVVRLGDKNDVANISHVLTRRGTLDGGVGGDRLDGSAGRDLLIGGPGDDELAGDGGRDHAIGGTGDDTFDAGDDAPIADSGQRVFGGVDADRFDGGPGTDRMSYFLRRHSVFVNLGDRAGDGGRREGDVLRSVESVTGSAAADRLVGSAADNFLSAEDGNDVLTGGAGDDELMGGAGDDVLRGGAGDDDLEGEEGKDIVDGGPGDDFVSASFAAEPRGETLRCGPGNDIVWGTYHDVRNNNPRPLPAAVDPSDVLIPDDCERAAVFGRYDVISSARPVAIEAGGARMHLTYKSLYSDPVVGFVQLDSGTAQFTVPANGAVDVVVPLSAETRARIAAGGAVLRGALARSQGDRIVAWSVRVDP